MSKAVTARTLIVCLMVAAIVAVALAPAFAGLIGSPITVKGSSAWFPNVCYNAYSNQYLALWMDYSVRPLIYGRRIDANTGALLGSEFVVSNWADPYRTYHPDAIYNSVNHEWLVVYYGCQPDQHEDIWAQRIDSAGNQIGGPIAVCSDAGYQNQVSVAFDPVNNRYLVTWKDGAGVDKIRGRVLDQYGSPVSSQMQISDSSPQDKMEPRCIFNPVSNEYLVVWMDDRNWDGQGQNNPWGDIYGQRITASTGAFVGGNFMVVGPTGTPYVADGMDVADNLAVNPQNGRYFIATTKLSGNWSVKAKILNPDGSAYAGLFDVSYPEKGLGVGATYNPIEDSFVITYLDGVEDVTMRRFSSSGAPMGSPFKVFSSNHKNNYGSLDIRTSDGQMMQVTIYFEDKITGARYNILGAQRFDVSGIAPASVSNFVAIPGTGQNVLTWHNPPDGSFTGTMIRFKTSGYPTGPTDGTLVVDKANSPDTNDSHTHTGLTNEITYYYAAYAHSGAPAYAAGVTSSAKPSAIPGLTLIPQPQELTWKAGTGFLVNGSTQIMTNSSPDAKETNMAQQLQRKVWDMTGYLPAIVYGGSATSNVIAVGDPGRCPAVSSIIATWSEASGRASKPEGYMLGVKDTSIVIRGWDKEGSFYGCQTLILLLEHFKTTRIAPVFSYDYPDLPIRGSGFNISRNHDWAFTKELFSEVFARYKINAIWDGPADGMAWDSHLELPVNQPDNPVTKGDFINLLNFQGLHYLSKFLAEGAGCGSTAGWLTAGTLHSNLREDLSEPETSSGESLCPSNAAARDLIYDLWDEALSFYPELPYLGGGHSEYSDLRWSGCTNGCMSYASNAAALSQFIWNDRTWINARGKTQWVFGDMLRADGTQPGSPSKWNTAPAVSTIPDDTVVIDWEYGTPGSVPTDYPTIDRWTSNGLMCIGMPYGFGSMSEYSQYYGDKENIYYWATALNARKAAYPNLIKGMVAFNKYKASDKQTSTTSALNQRFLGCFPYYAAWGWNVGDPYWNPYPYGDGWGMVERQLSPDRVSNLTTTPSGNNVILNWTNSPEAKFQAAYVVYRTDRYPTSPIDGTYLADVAGSPSAAGSYTHVNAPETAFYGVFAHDNVRHFSPAATAKNGGYCFEDYFAYANGALNGNGGWTGTATSSHIAVSSGYVRIFGGDGAYGAYKTVSCAADASGYITVTCKVNGETGTLTMWNIWIDDSTGHNLARWYGSGTSARGRIGTTGTATASQTLSGAWQELKVKIHPVNNTTEFFFEGTSLGVYSHSVTGAGDIVGSLGFERISNIDTTGDNLYFDDLTIGVLAPDTEPPGPVTNFLATGGDAQVSLNWTNPGDSDFAGTKILFKTTGYPTGPADGTQVYSGSGSSTTHTGLTNGVTYYYGAYAYDEVPNYSSAASASATPAGYCFRDLFSYSNGALVGQGGWTGNATASHIEITSGYVRIWGGSSEYYAQKTVSCGAVGGYIWVRCNINGEPGTDSTMWSLRINDSAGKNFARWYGSSTTARGRIGDTSTVTPIQNLSGAWQELAVKIDPTANTSEFFFDGNSIGTLSHGTQPGNVVQQIRFERMNNSSAAGQSLYFDDLRVGG